MKTRTVALHGSGKVLVCLQKMVMQGAIAAMASTSLINSRSVPGTLKNLGEPCFHGSKKV